MKIIVNGINIKALEEYEFGCIVNSEKSINIGDTFTAWVDTDDDQEEVLFKVVRKHYGERELEITVERV